MEYHNPNCNYSLHHCKESSTQQAIMTAYVCITASFCDAYECNSNCTFASVRQPSQVQRKTFKCWMVSRLYLNFISCLFISAYGKHNPNIHNHRQTEAHLIRFRECYWNWLKINRNQTGLFSSLSVRYCFCHWQTTIQPITNSNRSVAVHRPHQPQCAHNLCFCCGMQNWRVARWYAGPFAICQNGALAWNNMTGFWHCYDLNYSP